MNITNFNKGIASSTIGSVWWGVLGTFYFQYISFVGTLEVVVHRCLWTSLVLILTILTVLILAIVAILYYPVKKMIKRKSNKKFKK